MRRTSYTVLLILAAGLIAILSTLAEAKAVLTVSSNNMQICPGKKDAALGGIGFTFGGGDGLVGAGEAFGVRISAKLKGTPVLAGAPAGITLLTSAGTEATDITIRFDSAVSLAGAAMSLGGMIIDAPATSTIFSASLFGFSGASLSFSSASRIVVGTITVAGCVAHITSTYSELRFGGPAGVSPAAQALRVYNSAFPGLNMAPQVSATNVSWLSMQQTPEVGGEVIITVAVDATGLAENTTYSAVLTITANTDNSPLNIPVTVQMGKLARIDAAPSLLKFSAPKGASPPAQRLLIRNGGGGSFTPTVTISGAFECGITPAAGSDEGAYDVSVKSDSLAAGSYTGNVSIFSNDAYNSPLYVPVSLAVTQPGPVLALSAEVIALSLLGGDTQSKTVKLTNGGTGTLDYEALAISFGDWLSVSPTTGTAPGELTVTVKPSGLLPGTYGGTVRITSATAGVVGSPQHVKVVMTVQSPIGLAPSKLTFYALTGSSQTAKKTVSITNQGSGPLTWTALAVYTTGGAWFSINASSGTAPSTLEVTANPGGLAKGTYSGRIDVSAPGVGTVTLPVELIIADPAVNSGGIVNAAHSAGNGVAPGSIFSIYGTNLATGTAQASGNQVPDSLLGTVVLFGTVRGRLYYVSPTQINVQVPFELTSGLVAVKVVVNGVESAGTNINILVTDPGLFSMNGLPNGPAAALDASAGYKLITPGSPAARGDVIVVYGTGIGPLDTAISTGQLAPLDRLIHVSQPVRALIGMGNASVLFAGLAPGFAGLYQINIQIPASAAIGDAVPVSVIAGSRGSNAVTIAIR